MPYEESGAFWDATIYSPRSGKSLDLPLKRGLDPKKYGSYSREQFAYFFVYEARDKKGKRVFRFAQVPIWLASRIKSEQGALEAYAAELATVEKLEFVRIERAKILKNQLVEIDGDRLLLTGAEEFRNATELAFSQDELGEIVLGLSGGADCSVAAKIYMDIEERLATRCPHLSAQLKLSNYSLEEVSAESLWGAVAAILAIARAASNVADMSQIGGAKSSGRIRPSRKTALNDPNCGFYIIDQSVTGMFERKTRIGL